MKHLDTRTVEVEDVKITVTEASILIGMKRGRMKAEALNKPDPNPDRQILAVVTYPDMIAPVTLIEGMELPTFDEFLALPESLIDQWGAAVYALNPHWLPQTDGELEKKVSGSISAS